MSDWAPMFEKLDAVAPPLIEPDVANIADSLKQQEQTAGARVLQPPRRAGLQPHRRPNVQRVLEQPRPIHSAALPRRLTMASRPAAAMTVTRIVFGLAGTEDLAVPVA
jgi:hypothetical protein